MIFYFTINMRAMNALRYKKQVNIGCSVIDYSQTVELKKTDKEVGCYASFYKIKLVCDYTALVRVFPNRFHRIM